ncbi:MAG: hypothetical protein R2751_18910 [Bacteroidales bacterium]
MYTLRGGDPVLCHLNNILDYTFYWFIAIHDYYLYTGDLDFVRQVYPKMESLLILCWSAGTNRDWWKAWKGLGVHRLARQRCGQERGGEFRADPVLQEPAGNPGGLCPSVEGRFRGPAL